MSTTNPNDILNLVNQMGTKDPKMQMLAQLMQQNQENTATEDDDQSSKIRKLVAHIKKQAAFLKRLEQSNQKMKKKVNYLVENLNYRLEVNDLLAGAVGACPECWGEEPDCKQCHGRGHPGTLAIDRTSFESIVLPALEAYKRAEKATEP